MEINGIIMLSKKTVSGSLLLALSFGCVLSIDTKSDYEESQEIFVYLVTARPQILTDANKNNSVPTVTLEDKIDAHDAFIMERVLLQMFIVICGTAGVFVLCFVCCVQCLLQAKTHRNHDLPNNMRTVISFQSDEENERHSFIPMHHHPWSPGVLQNPETFDFHYDENRDKPPPYDDIETPCSPLSPPPPPYTPSFAIPDNSKSDLNSQMS
ncbi:unnamed protein product [Orchesella dallaii]|uniref:Uncharacterized protein n=1 Tax=Orchesella dallaii TaxID=48710 RepID=A0ABP1Q4D4_9HEXA